MTIKEQIIKKLEQIEKALQEGKKVNMYFIENKKEVKIVEYKEKNL